MNNTPRISQDELEAGILFIVGLLGKKKHYRWLTLKEISLLWDGTTTSNAGCSHIEHIDPSKSVNFQRSPLFVALQKMIQENELDYTCNIENLEMKFTLHRDWEIERMPTEDDKDGDLAKQA